MNKESQKSVQKKWVDQKVPFSMCLDSVLSAEYRTASRMRQRQKISVEN